MRDPPSYDETIASEQSKTPASFSGDEKTPQRFSIRDEVGASRAQHVAALIEKLLPQIRERARSGLSRTTLLLLPSDQDESSRKGELVGFPQDDRPVLIKLEGRYDTTQFWTQNEALKTLQEQMLVALIGELPVQTQMEPVPEISAPPPKASFWVRKQSKAPEPKPKPASPPVRVDVEHDQINFRTETEYGLYETIRSRAVLVVVDVR